jgi:hypothetical protein
MGWMCICGDWKLYLHLERNLKYPAKTTRTNFHRIFASFLRLNNLTRFERKKLNILHFTGIFNVLPEVVASPLQLYNWWVWTGVYDPVRFS